MFSTIRNKNGAFDREIIRRFTLVAICIFGLILRFYRIDQSSFDLGEALSLWFSDQSWSQLWNFVPIIEHIPPLFSSILKIWKTLGESEIILRSLSAFISTATIPITYLLGRIAGGKRYGTSIGLGAALFVSVSPLHLEYAQVARYTATLTFVVTLTLCALAWLMRNPQRSCTPRFGFAYDPSRNTAKKIDLSASMAWLGLTLGTALSLWLHSLSPFFVASIILVMIVWWAWGLRRNQAFLFNALIAGGVAFLLWLPFLPMLWKILGNVSKQFWILEPSFLDVAYVIDIWFGVNHLHFWSFFPLAFAALFGLWVIWREAGLPLVMLLIGTIVIPIAMMFASTYVFRPMWLHRPLYWVSVPYYVLVAAGICQLRQRWVRVSATVFLAVILAAGTVNYYLNYRQQPWNDVVDKVLQESGPNSLVLLLPNTIEIPFAYYAKRKGLEARVVGLPLPFPAIDVPDHPYPGDISSGPGMMESDLPKLRSELPSRSPVWLVTKQYELYDPHELIPKVLTETRVLVEEQHYLDRISVYRFD